jgi:hypothetical protein
MHPLSHRKRLRRAEKCTSVSPCLLGAVEGGHGGLGGWGRAGGWRAGLKVFGQLHLEHRAGEWRAAGGSAGAGGGSEVGCVSRRARVLVFHMGAWGLPRGGYNGRGEGDARLRPPRFPPGDPLTRTGLRANDGPAPRSGSGGATLNQSTREQSATLLRPKREGSLLGKMPPVGQMAGCGAGRGRGLSDNAASGYSPSRAGLAGLAPLIQAHRGGRRSVTRALPARRGALFALALALSLLRARN